MNEVVEDMRMMRWSGASRSSQALPGSPDDSAGSTGEVPALVCSPAGVAGAPAVLFYHGLRASKEVHRKEGRLLAQAGFAAVLIDAPHHGARHDALLEQRDITGLALDRLLVRLVTDAVAEVPALVDQLLAAGHRSVAIAGISMGAYIALAAAVVEPRLAAIVSLLGSPSWAPEDGVPADMMEAVGRDPLHLHDALVARPLLMINGGKDVNVRPEGARELAALLRPKYAAAGASEALVHVELPDADHFPGERDWDTLWTTTVGFLTRILDP
ncbi:MAG TPA: alpha/beta fold hydrolase [Nannocystis sp.]